MPYPRDLIGYAGMPPVLVLPGGAQLAVSLVVNFEEGAEHAVGDGDPGDRVADRQHRPDVLVADRRPRLDRHAAVVDVEVGAADAGRLDPDDRLVGVLEPWLGSLLDPHLARRLESHRPHDRNATGV